jgi:diguanylate cyclase (GGDEF)-like protein
MPTVLVIDDDADIANLFGMVFGLAGFECEVAHSAREALSRLAIRAPDLILLDMALETESGGQDVLYQVRSNPRLKNSQVVVINGDPSIGKPVSDLADIALLKPVHVEQLEMIATRLKTKVQTAKPEYFHDPVTGMYNKEFFNSRLELAIQRARRRPDFIFAIIIIVLTLDQPVEQPFDPAIFDKILREAADSLVHNMRPTDTAARLSYYKFATLHEELRDPTDVKIISNRIRSILTPSFRLNDRQVKLLFHIGQATNRDDYKTMEDLYKIAERDLERTIK